MLGDSQLSGQRGLEGADDRHRLAVELGWGLEPLFGIECQPFEAGKTGAGPSRQGLSAFGADDYPCSLAPGVEPVDPKEAFESARDLESGSVPDLEAFPRFPDLICGRNAGERPHQGPAQWELRFAYSVEPGLYRARNEGQGSSDVSVSGGKPSLCLHL